MKKRPAKKSTKTPVGAPKHPTKTAAPPPKPSAPQPTAAAPSPKPPESAGGLGDLFAPSPCPVLTPSHVDFAKQTVRDILKIAETKTFVDRDMAKLVMEQALQTIARHGEQKK